MTGLISSAVSVAQEPIASASPPRWGEALNDLALALGAARFEELHTAASEEAFARGVWWELDGVKAHIPLMLRPRMIEAGQRDYVHEVSWQIRTGLERVAWLAAMDARAAAVLPLSADERPWFELVRPRRGGASAFCRLDGLIGLDGPDWRRSLKFVETNVIGSGGMTYSPVLEQIVSELVIPRLTSGQPPCRIERNADPRHLLLAELLEHARARGLSHPPTIAYVDDKSLYSLGGELGRQAPYVHSLGIETIYADPRELELGPRGEITAGGRRIDLCFRFVSVADLAKIERSHGRLDAMRAAFARDMVLPTIGGDLEHKSTFELLTDPLYRSAFDRAQLRAFDDHVLWTRLIHERRTTDPAGREVDLLPYAAQNQQELVIKPNRLDGGEGVVIGACCDQASWLQALHEAAMLPRSHVVQLAAAAVAERFPLLRDTAAAAPRELGLEALYTTTGFFPGRSGLGIFGRYAQSRVVNICQGGGIVPFLVGQR